MSGKSNSEAGAAKRVPELLSFLGRHMAFGLAMGVTFASMLLLLDVAGLRQLIETTREPYVALFLFHTFNALTFASVAMGVAVMTLPMDEVCEYARQIRAARRVTPRARTFDFVEPALRFLPNSVTPAQAEACPSINRVPLIDLARSHFAYHGKMDGSRPSPG